MKQDGKRKMLLMRITGRLLQVKIIGDYVYNEVIRNKYHDQTVVEMEVIVKQETAGNEHRNPNIGVDEFVVVGDED